MKRISLLYLSILMVACFSEDGIDLGTPSTFIKFFSDGYNNEAVALEETTDGGFIILMNSTIQDSEAETARNKVSLINTDQYGSELWRTYYPPIDQDTARWMAHSLTLVENGGYLIMGESINTQTGSSSMLTFKVDDAGNNLISKVFRPKKSSDPANAFSYSTTGAAATIKISSDASNGNYLFVASSENPVGKMIVGELNASDLSLAWSISRGEDAVSILTNRVFFSVGGDNLIYWGGTVIKDAGEKSDIRFTKNPINTIPSGDPNLGDPSASEAANDMCLSGNIFCFAGSIDETTAGNNKDIYFLRGSNEKVTYKKEFIPRSDSSGFTNDKNEEANSISSTKDGGFIILATIDTYTGVIGRGNTDVLLMKVNAFGEYQWSVDYGSLDADIGKAVRQTSDGGYIALATARLAGTRTLMLIKTDKTGDVD